MPVRSWATVFAATRKMTYKMASNKSVRCHLRLIEPTKENGLDPFQYLPHIFSVTTVPNKKTGREEAIPTWI